MFELGNVYRRRDLPGGGSRTAEVRRAARGQSPASTQSALPRPTHMHSAPSPLH